MALEDIEFTPEKAKLIIELTQEFATTVIRPAGKEWDQREEFPWEIVQEAARRGLYDWEILVMALKDPTNQTLPTLIETTFEADAGIGMALWGSALAAAAIANSGTKEQREEWVPKCYGDERNVQLGAFGVSESHAGSDVANLRSYAVFDEKTGDWILNGEKTWITNGGIAETTSAIFGIKDAKFPNEKLRSRGQANFIIPRGTKGLTYAKIVGKHGIRASHTATLWFDNVRIPHDFLLGGKDTLDLKLARARELEKAQIQELKFKLEKALEFLDVGNLAQAIELSASAGSSGSTGYKQPAMATFNATRPMVGAMANGVALAALRYATDYAKGRFAFGKSIAQHQLVAEMLAEMALKVKTSRLLVSEAARLAVTTGCHQGEGSMAKLHAGRTAFWVTERAIQVLGGAGYTSDHPVAQWNRDAKIFDIFEGTEQIQQRLVAEAVTSLRVS